MMRPWPILAFLAAAAWTQNPPLKFEVASIKPAAPQQPGQLTAGVHIDGAQAHLTFLSIRDLIRAGYNVKDYQIEGPDFIATERFDISAKLASAATRDQIGEMIQSLLADRFGFKQHRETRDFPVYALVIDKGGLKMVESPADIDPSNVSITSTAGPNGTTVDLGKGAFFTVGAADMQAHKLTMANLADMLSRFEDLPVIDATGTKGVFDFTLQVNPEEFQAMKYRSARIAGAVLTPEILKQIESASDDSLRVSLAKLGLKLERRKMPLEVIVINHVDKTPTEN